MQTSARITDVKYEKIGNTEVLYLTTDRGKTTASDDYLLKLYHAHRLIGTNITVNCEGETTENDYNCMSRVVSINSRNK